MRAVPNPIGYLSSQAYVSHFDEWARKTLNQYSRRAFAKWAGIPSSNFLTLIISNKRPFQLGWHGGFVKAAKLNAQQAAYLKTLLKFEQAKGQEEKTSLQEQLRQELFSTKLNLLQHKDLYLISSPEVWSLYIALSLDCDESDQAVTLKKRLKIDLARIREVFKNFEALDLVNIDKNGRLEAKYKFINTDNDYSRIENQSFHKKVLIESSQKLERLPPAKRSYGSLTVVLDKEEFISLQKDIQNFGKSLLAKYGDKNNQKKKEILARVNLQFYPLTEDLAEEI